MRCIRNRKTEEKNHPKPQKKKFGQNRQKTDTMVTSGAYRANYTNTLFHQSICECLKPSYILVSATIIGFISAALSSPDFVGSFSLKHLVMQPS